METLNLTESSDGSLSGTLFDSTLAGAVVGQANLDGRRSGSDVTFTARYTGNLQGAVATFRGTFNGTTIEGRATGVCGQGAQDNFFEELTAFVVGSKRAATFSPRYGVRRP